jgi:4a-hydroxytetrahydrobiopterin dehydratase
MAANALSQDAVRDALSGLRGWEHNDDMLSKTYEFDSYLAGVAFAAAVATVAEGRDHHPDMLVTWRKVKVSFTTHDAGSKVTQKDVDAARAVESLGYPA